MARLIHIDAATIERQRSELAPPAAVPAVWRASRPRDPVPVEPWFELGPRAPAVDSRVSAGAGLGVAASLATFGGVTGPGLGSAAGPRDGVEPPAIVLGGNAVALDAAEPDTVAEFERQCAMRLAIWCEGLAPTRQCLVAIALRALGPEDSAVVQVFVGTTRLATPRIGADDRLAVLVDTPSDGRLACALWIRLCGGRRTRLGIHGVTGHLL